LPESSASAVLTLSDIAQCIKSSLKTIVAYPLLYIYLLSRTHAMAQFFRTLLYVGIVLFGLPQTSYAQGAFVVKDILAADPGASIIDPEYNTALNLVCWQSDDRELWICSLDPLTRMFVPSDGKGMLIDQDLTPPTFGGWNGPEWLLCAGSTQIVYNQKKGGVRYPGIATQLLGGWSSSTLMQYPGTLYAMATNDYTDSLAMFLFESDSYDGIRWVSNTDLNTCNFYPNITLGFFARDNQQICCAINHSRQPGYLEVATNIPFFTQISNDTIGAPFMWNDPETNSRMFMYRTNGNQTVKIFQENNDGNWYLYHSFNSPMADPYIYITSPEPFTFKGKSYISFMAAQAEMGLSELPAQIWITSINPMNPFMRRVSDSTESIRIDPEPVVFEDSAFIYYTEKVYTRWWQIVRRVRKCNTGLEDLYTGLQKPVSSGIQVYPNPAGDQAVISLGTDPGVSEKQVEILNSSGQCILRRKTRDNQLKIETASYPAGCYYIRVIDQSNISNQKLIISR